MSRIGPVRHDYQFPLRINGAQRQAERAAYPAHVAQMIRQFLLTTPGERVGLPDFGGGLRSIIFAPKSVGLTSATELLVRRGLEKYLGQHITVLTVKVTEPEGSGDGAIEVLIEYQLIETRTNESLILQVP